jgi:EAL and modified HD-GYP domain-containing signal transduction protein
MHGFVARQPIFARQLQVIGYELLFRDSAGGGARFLDGDEATARTLVRGLMDVGLDRLVGDKLAFVNLTRGFFLEQHRLPALQDRLVLEILEDITPDAALIEAVAELARSGYTLALDDFIFRDDLRPLLGLVHIIKIDLPQVGLDGLAAHVERLRPYGCRLLVEKIETHAEFERCKALGIDYFQGYFLSRPQTLSARSLPANKLAVLQVLAQVQDPEASIEALERLIGADAALAYRLLRFANSANFAAARQVDSIRRAIVLTGMQQIRAWASLLLLARLDDKPQELLRIALLRCRLCERLAALLGRRPPESYATVGLLSVLDALLDQPLDVLLQDLPLAAPLQAALRERAGPIGELLQAAIALERGDVGPCGALGVCDEQVSGLALEAVAWTEQQGALLDAGA